MNTQMKKGVLELCVLSMLSRGDRYGYELTESLSEEMSIAPGTLYLILKRLKDDECVETYLVESESGRRGSIITLRIREMRHYCSRRTTGSSL